MTYQQNCTLPTELLEQIAVEGMDALPELIRILINGAMRLEREQHLGAGPYERTPERKGHANGYKPKTVKTRVGEIEFEVPQVRQGKFYPDALKKGLRSERALTLALAEMYVQGVSTRRVAAITEQLCGTAVSSMQVSRASEKLDEVLEAWRTRPLGQIVYLYLDARYEKVRMDGQIRDAAILIASGVGRDGKRCILGVSVSLSEAKQHWRTMDYSTIEKLTSGDVDLSQNWNGAAMRARADRPTLQYAYPKEGYTGWMDNVAVLKDAPNMENAKLFVNFIMAPENAALISAFARYANGIKGSEEFMPDDMKDAPEVGPIDVVHQAHAVQDAPEVAIPAEFQAAGRFNPTCPPEVQELYTAIWTELQK